MSSTEFTLELIILPNSVAHKGKLCAILSCKYCAILFCKFCSLSYDHYSSHFINLSFVQISHRNKSLVFFVCAIWDTWDKIHNVLSFPILKNTLLGVLLRYMGCNFQVFTFQP